MTPPLHGWLNIDKPLGMTSQAVCGHIKRWLGGKRGPKVGHAGTLDPLASGILPIAIGEATKTVPFLVDAVKTYVFEVTFGRSTTTDDAEGETVLTSDILPTEEAIRTALPHFIGDIHQIPPVYSAIKLGGKRAYALARRGEEVEIAPRRIKIFDFHLRSRQSVSQASFEVVCSKGTYVRALGRDLAIFLGTVGHISALRRTRVGPFEGETAWTLEALESYWLTHQSLPLLAVNHVLVDIPACVLSVELTQRLRRGLAVPAPQQGTEKEIIQCVDPAGLVALATYQDGMLYPYRVFNYE